MTKEQKQKRAYYLKNRRRILAKVKAYRTVNGDRIRARDKARARWKTEGRKAYMRRYQRKNRKRLAAKARANALKNREAVRARQRKWYLANKSKVVAKARTSALRHPTKRKANSRRFYHRNRDYYRAAVVLRRARLCSATVGDVKAITAHYKTIRNAKSVACHWCRKPVPKGHRHIDHVVPLAKGGSHCVTNLVPACASCNRRKSAKLPGDFRP